MAQKKFIELEDIGGLVGIHIGKDTPEDYVIDVVEDGEVLYTIDRQSSLSEGSLPKARPPKSYKLIVRHRTNKDVTALHTQEVSI
jgi:hypothetical protein